MKRFEISLPAALRSLYLHRHLILDLARRDAVGRYRGSLLGILWSFLTPLLMLGVYTFVFSEVFKARWGGGTGSKSEFAIVLFTGLIIFNIFAECIGRAPSIIVGNANFVKKIVFPLEVLPVVNLLSALFHAGISMAVLLAFELFEMRALPSTAWMVILVLVPHALFVLGLSWWLAATGVYLRDIGQTIGIAITALMFLSPIFFPASALPESVRFLANLNPLTYPIEQARDVLVWGHSLQWERWGMSMFFSTLVAWLGFAWFQSTRKGFADVL
ncbi:ABC transporter permease [Cupriavidus necator]|uniref:ABC transporter permease n=1 Tax=Cupriavidus necator TaxID=106590 RepID=UPI003F7339F4